MLSFLDTAEKYEELVVDWIDPFPKPQVIEHDGIHVVRDDLINVGSKARFSDHLVRNLPHKELVYGSSPACGYAQISVAYLCKQYNKKAVFFMAKRNMENLHPYQKRALDLGLDVRWIKDGMMVVCEKRAKDYVSENPWDRIMLPMGLKHPMVIGAIIKTCKSLNIEPDHVWSVGSSGTLSKGLQLAFPEAEVHVVQTGHKMSSEEIGRAIHHVSPYQFVRNAPANELPPFPSAPNYDAKCWKIMNDYYKTNTKPKTVLMWNVGA